MSTHYSIRRVLVAAGAASTLACGALTACTSVAAPTAATTVSHPDRDHAGAAAGQGHAATTSAPAGVQGLDVSGWQENVDWNAVKASGAKFAFVKATENTDYKSGEFSQQFNGSYGVGLAHSAYHFAVPNATSGKAQADFFADNGGGRTGDGRTFPGVLDIEDNPYGTDKCYDMTPAQMVAWIHDFINEYHARTGWWAIINTFTEWWNDCTAKSTAFAAKDPLWINNHGTSAGTLPSGWTTYTVWQWADDTAGVFPGDQDVIQPDVFARLLAEARH